MSDHKHFKKPISKSRGGNPRDLAPIRISWDTLNSEYAPRQHALVAPTVGIFDAPYGCVRVNKEWLSHVAGMIAVLLELDAWTGDDDGYAARQEIYKLLAALEADCEEIPVACCDDLIIELQQVKNEVTNIRNTVNYYNTDTTTILNDYSQLINTYNNSLDVVLDIAPDNKVPSVTGDQALCAAISEFVDTVALTQIQALDQSTLIAGAVAVAVSVAAAFASGGSSLLLQLAAAAGITTGAVGIVDTAAGLIFGDAAALAEVKCCMFDQMKGLEPTLAVFQASATGCTGLSANSDQIRFTVEQTLLADNVHASFLARLDELYDQAALGLTGDCSSCDDGDVTDLALTRQFGATVTATRLADNRFQIAYSGGTNDFKAYISSINNPSGSLSGSSFTGIYVEDDSLFPTVVESQLPLVSGQSLPSQFDNKKYVAFIAVFGGGRVILTSVTAILNVTITNP